MTKGSITRRLTTIVAADVAGFARLTSSDEEETLVALHSHRTEAIEPRIAEHQGRIANTAGDGLLIEFPSVVEAVRCALKIQNDMLERNKKVPEDRRIRFRIGINVGDVVDQNGDLLGNGVNVAARLEEQAPAGGIWISQSAREQVIGHLNVPLSDLGEIEVKNIPRPIRVYQVGVGEESAATTAPRARSKYRLALAGGSLFVLLVASATVFVWWETVFDTSPKATNVVPPISDKPSIAVMPFENLSGDPDQLYFADGMTDDLITDLSKVSGLFVIARATTAVYRGRKVTAKQVADELGVSHVLEGSVRRSGNRIRVTAQLIDPATSRPLWADRYDREFTNIFQLQDELTQNIVSTLAIQLTRDEESRLSRQQKTIPEAYDTLLRGLESFRRFTPETIAEGRKLFEKAIELDPNYARAHANIAFSYAISVFSGFSLDPKGDLETALRYGRKALALDPDVPQVHFSLGLVYWQLGEISEALSSIDTALKFDPNYADAYANLAAVKIYVGDYEEGLQAIQTAMRLNPRHPFFYIEIKGRAHFAQGDYAQAAAEFESALQRNPEFTVARRELAATYAHLGRIEDAEWEIEEVLANQPQLKLSDERSRTIFQAGADLDRYIEGLRKAGLPE